MTSEYRTFLRGYERNIFRGRGGDGLLFLPPPPPPQKSPDSRASHLRTLPKTTFSLQVQKMLSAFMLTFFFFFFKKTEQITLVHRYSSLNFRHIFESHVPSETPSLSEIQGTDRDYMDTCICL